MALRREQCRLVGADVASDDQEPGYLSPVRAQLARLGGSVPGYWRYRSACSGVGCAGGWIPRDTKEVIGPWMSLPKAGRASEC